MSKIKEILKKEPVRIILVLTALALVAAVVLGVVNRFTVVDEDARFREKIGENYESPLTEKEFDLSGYQNMEYTEILNVYQAANGAVVILSKSKKAYSAAGIELIVIINDKKLEKVILNAASETPGLGTRALTEEYLSKYTEFDVDDFFIPTGDEITSSTKKAASVDLISGATRSSTGVKYAVEAAVAVYKYLEKEGQI